MLPTAKRSLSEVKTAGLSPPRKRLAAKPVASCLRAHFIRSVVALCVISCATAAGGVAIAAGRHPIEAGTESFLQQQARRKAIDRESRLVRAELELAQLATYVRSHLPLRVSMKKLRQSASATARWEAERKAAAQLPLLSDLDFENPQQLKNAAARIAKAIRTEAKGSRVKNRKLLLSRCMQKRRFRVGEGLGERELQPEPWK